MKSLHTTLRGMDAENIVVSRTKYGSNKVTHEKKQSLAKRLAGAFINPFTAILFCLAVVSTMTDMVFPYFSCMIIRKLIITLSFLLISWFNTIQILWTFDLFSVA